MFRLLTKIYKVINKANLLKKPFVPILIICSINYNITGS